MSTQTQKQATGMAVLSLHNITKRFGNLLANDDISLSLDSGEIVALLGENGAGKTTLMNILFGHYAADTGHIEVSGQTLPPESTDAALKAGIGMVHQHFTLADNMSVLDNIILGTESLWSPRSNRSAAVDKLTTITDSLQLNIDLFAVVAHLSLGERQRVEILKALYRDVRILILDEPTAVLTPQEVDNLFALLRRMATDGMAIVIISHKLHEVLSISHRVVVLRHGKLVGSADTESVNRDELAEMIVGRQVVRPALDALPAGDPILSLQDLSVRSGSSASSTLHSINLTVHAHRIVGVAGVSGNGQSELAAVLSGLRKPDSGKFIYRQNVLRRTSAAKFVTMGIARIPEDRHAAGVVGEMTVWENLLLDDLGQAPCWRGRTVINRAAARERADHLIKTFDIRCASMDIPAALLSGGNMQKLILARNFQKPPGFVMANQPARGLDEGAIAFVHKLLLDARRSGAGVLLISEDLDELLRLSDEIVVMHNGKLSEPLNAATLSTRDLGVLMTGGNLEKKVDHAL